MNTDHHDKLIKELAQVGLGALAYDLTKLFNVSHVVVTDDAQDIFVGDFGHAIYAKYEPIMYNKKETSVKRCIPICIELRVRYQKLCQGY